jgi:hypothetical protein
MCAAGSVKRVNSASSTLWLWLALHATWLLPDWLAKWQRLVRGPAGGEQAPETQARRAAEDRGRDTRRPR